MEQQRADDRGFTLVEVLVSATVLGLAGLVFAAGMVQMYRTAGRTEALATAQNAVHVAYQRLDKELRYAAAVGEPSAAADARGHWYVEYLTTWTGAPVCTQLRLGAALERRSWPAAGQPGGTWTTLAGGVAADGVPFALTPATAGGAGRQRLTVRLVAGAGGARDASVRGSAVTFTALNSAVGTPAPAQCTRHRPAP